jgi:hypothetical protein
MTKYLCLAVNGLHEELFASPLGQLAGRLNRDTPAGVHFNVVGAMDPRPFIFEFEHTCAAAAGAGYKLILIGHSLGAMMMFYLADAAKKHGIKVPFVCAIDATQWGTNLPAVGGADLPYALANQHPGNYWVPNNVDHFMYFRQPVYPGGGYAHLGPGNTHTKFDNYDRIEAHVVLPIVPDIQDKILQAVLEATKE